MTQNDVRSQGSPLPQTFTEDNVVTRAQQGHLSLLDWQKENPLQEQARMPKPYRRSFDWYMAGVLLLMAGAAIAGADILSHLAW